MSTTIPGAQITDVVHPCGHTTVGLRTGSHEAAKLAMLGQQPCFTCQPGLAVAFACGHILVFDRYAEWAHDFSRVAALPCTHCQQGTAPANVQLPLKGGA